MEKAISHLDCFALQSMTIDQVVQFVVEDDEGFKLDFFEFADKIIAEKDLKPVTVELRVEAYQAKYVRSLPLHGSQKEISTTDDYSVFQYHLVPTFDFRQEILSRGPAMEVLTSKWFREEIMDDIAKMASRYMMPVTNEDGIPYIDEEDEWKYL